jgi:hypothetical protein
MVCTVSGHNGARRKNKPSPRSGPQRWLSEGARSIGSGDRDSSSYFLFFVVRDFVSAAASVFSA